VVSVVREVGIYPIVLMHGWVQCRFKYPLLLPVWVGFTPRIVTPCMAR
jgi:hypothetical protein